MLSFQWRQAMFMKCHSYVLNTPTTSEEGLPHSCYGCLKSCGVFLMIISIDE